MQMHQDKVKQIAHIQTNQWCSIVVLYKEPDAPWRAGGWQGALPRHLEEMTAE
jgi:hypothetical protein